MVLFYLSLVPKRGVQQVLQLTYQLVPYGSQMWLAGQKLTSYSSMRFPFECQVGIQWHQLLDKQFAASTTGKPQQKKRACFTNNNDGNRSNKKKGTSNLQVVKSRTKHGQTVTWARNMAISSANHQILVGSCWILLAIDAIVSISVGHFYPRGSLKASIKTMKIPVSSMTPTKFLTV